MDKNSIIGLLLMGGILFGFTVFFGPDKTEVTNKTEIAENKELHKQDSLIKVETEKVDTPDAPLMPAIPALWSLKKDSLGNQIIDSLSNQPVYVNSQTGKDSVFTTITNATINFEEKTEVLKNDLLTIEVSTKGGRISKAFLNKYKNYTDFIDEKENTLQLFDDKTTYGITFMDNGKLTNTKDLDFKIITQNDSIIKLQTITNSGAIEFTYKVKSGSYDVDYSVAFKGFKDDYADKTSFVANVNLLSTEKHLPSEQRASSVYYDDDGSYNYLSISDDDEVLETKTKWVAFKQSFFSAIIMKEDGFGIGSTIEAKKPLDIEVDSIYIRDYSANLNLGLKNMSNTVDLQWYFGPNDYDVLALHKNGSQDVVDLGWGLFRWINVYALRPMYKAFVNWGMGAGLAILLLTFIVKLALSPVNYKMYKSSAMMKVLKPEIAQIQAKYPDKKDAMKKQQELMALYREAGASPMAGCVPMLFQMPILFAIFRLFPSSIEMRQKGFLWAEDLTSYDSVYNFGYNIPLYGDHISLFTLLMAGTTLVYTHFNSSNMQQPQQEGMPNMKYIMYFFPIMMIFFFNNYSSGLSFYYFISTLMTMLIMMAIKYFILDEKKIHAKIAANKANPKKPKGKSKFAQRLEEAQRLQQERAKKK